MFALQIATPVYGELKLIFNRFENLYRLGIRKSYEFVALYVIKSVNQPFIDEIIQKSKFVGASFHNVTNYVFYHCLGDIHIV